MSNHQICGNTESVSSVQIIVLCQDNIAECVHLSNHWFFNRRRGTSVAGIEIIGTNEKDIIIHANTGALQY
ncbi:MAG TPA: hypothetical protein PLV70_12665 [Flavobacteriales bacterium]|nr:hypothetical protein [Flavobacteriales bacterium]HRO40720.1 hypothetical protein [Flavobacteriales bacterium]HRQ85959.1 hypothetical protein [Flavobacteriales bacterium]